MTRLDAALPGILSEEDVARQLASMPMTIRQAALPAPAPVAAPPPVPVDDRPLSVIETELIDARARLNGILEDRLQLAAKLEEVERAVEEARASAPLSPSATAAVRAERDRLQAELAEMDVLVERQNDAHDRAAAAWQSGRYAQIAGETRARLAVLVERAAESDAAISAAIEAVWDEVDARFALIDEAKREANALNALPPIYWVGPVAMSGGQRQPNTNYVPAGLSLDLREIKALKIPGRRRRIILGI